MADQRITTETGAGAHGRRWRALALLGVAQFMLILDVTVVAIALPHIGADLDLSRSALTWVVSAYTLTFGGLMLLGGRGADLFGARGLVLAGLATFTAASLVVGLAGGAEVLIAGRVAQGLGAAMLSPRRSRSWCGCSRGRSGTRRSASGPRSAAAAPPSVSCSAAC